MVFYGIFWSGQYPIASFPISLVLGLCLIILRKFSNMVTLFWNKSSKITITIVISLGVLFFGEYLLSIGICSCVTVQHFMQFQRSYLFVTDEEGNTQKEQLSKNFELERSSTRTSSESTKIYRDFDGTTSAKMSQTSRARHQGILVTPRVSLLN